MNTVTTCYQSPIGQLVVSGTEKGILSVRFNDNSLSASQNTSIPYCMQEAIEQLHEYFCHQREEFDLKLNLSQGTHFQQRVWEILKEIPWGETRSYAQIAHLIGQPLAVRAVGAANANNPFLIILPCHRIIGSSGILTGYAGGLLRKQWLLKHEQQTVQLEIF